MIKVAVLDDWQRVAAGCADWSRLTGRAEVSFLHDSFAGEDALVAAVAAFDIILPMRERSRFPKSVLSRLPRLKMMALTGIRAPHVDLAYCSAHGIVCCSSGSPAAAPTAEFALGMLLAAARHIPAGDAAMRAGRFLENMPLGLTLEGATLGIIGLGRLGGRMASYGKALGMRVLAWSTNLTADRAAEAGITYATKDQLLAESDAISIHLVLSDRSRGLIGAADIARMKQGAILVNTSRGPIIDEAALVAALRALRIVAALDVYDVEPLPADHPLRSAPNTVLTPHIGYPTVDAFDAFYGQSLENIIAFLDGAPIRIMNPDKARSAGKP